MREGSGFTSGIRKGSCALALKISKYIDRQLSKQTLVVSKIMMSPIFGKRAPLSPAATEDRAGGAAGSDAWTFHKPATKTHDTRNTC